MRIRQCTGRLLRHAARAHLAAWVATSATLSLSAGTASGDEVPDGWGLAEPASEALVLGEPAFVVIEDSASKVLRFEVDRPGLMALAAVGEAGGDVVVMVADELGQALRNAHLDWDASNVPGGEYGAAALAEPGVYFVVLRSWDGRAGVNLLASFHPLEGFVAEVDPQGRPDEALPLRAAVPVKQSLDMEAGDHRDWYRFEASRNGVVRFRTRTPDESSTDLGIEVYTQQDFTWAAAEGDADEGERMGDESVELVVGQGEVVFVRVNAWSTEGESAYTIEARWKD